MGGAGAKYHALREDYPGHTNGKTLANGEENLEVSVCVDGLKLKSCTTVSDEIEKQLVDENCLSIVFLMLQPSCHVLCNSVFSPIAKAWVFIAVATTSSGWLCQTATPVKPNFTMCMVSLLDQLDQGAAVEDQSLLCNLF